MKTFLFILMSVLLFAAPCVPQSRVSNVVSVQLSMVVPEMAQMTVAPANTSVPLGPSNPYIVTINYNLAEAPSLVAVKYNGESFTPGCPESGCVLMTAQQIIKITVPFQPGDQRFQLVIV